MVRRIISACGIKLDENVVISVCFEQVTISGGLIVANALNESIDVSIVFSTRNGNEMSYSIAGRSQGPSQIVDINDIHCFQFKLSSIEESNSGWSFGVTLEDMRKSVNRAVAMKLVCKCETFIFSAFRLVVMLFLMIRNST